MIPAPRSTGDTSWQRLGTLAARAQNLGPVARYTIAISAAAIGLGAREVLEPLWIGRLPYLTLFPAIMVSAWLGGLGPGLTTTCLSAAGVAYLWLEPIGSFRVGDLGDLIGLVVFVLVGVVISALNEAWRRGTVALAESEYRLAVTLASIGDAVLTTDEYGYVTGMNDVAERLTGWSLADARGMAVEDIMVLVSEETGMAVPNPARQVLHVGKVATLQRHTLLVTRDGSRIPIDDGAAPIRVGQDETAGAILVFRDIAERRQMELERETQSRIASELAAIVETSDDAIVSKDLEGIVRSWNQGAERIFGYTAADMIGRSIRTIIPEERWGEEDEVLRQLRQGNRVDHFETVRRRKDGSEVHVSLTISPIHSTAGTVIGASKIARDITERRRAEAERAQLLEREQQVSGEIERAGRMKDDFLAVLSHELRTPLNAVMGYAQLLQSGAISGQDVAHAYQAIQRNAQAQARLVESLLDLSRILAGKLELNSEAIELSSVIALAVDAVRPEALMKQITLDVGDAEGVRVWGDAPRLQQVFWNLLSNAVKFTPAGGRVTVHVLPAGGDVSIRVEDNGRGIPAALLPFVFDRFKQGEEPGQSRSGLGLGLALVREVVHAHGGTVTAESAGEGRGTTVTVRLHMLARANEPSPIAYAGLLPSAALHQLQPDVLIVDDERDAREMLALMLETRGARVRHVGSAAEAFDSMVDRRPDVLLADLGMVGEDGYSLIRRWRAQERGAQLEPVAAIAVTAYASAGDRERARDAGFNWHVAKPVDADELIRVIAGLHAGELGSTERTG